MKRRFKALLLSVLLILLVLPIRAYAHPGRTDSNGGHTDSDTGDYHYHHGYPAHDHYDMDGDGIIDCPYDFDDQTGENRGSSGGSTNGYANQSSNYSSGNISGSSSPETPTQQLHKGENGVPSWVYWLFAGQAVVIIGLIISNSSKKDTIRIMESCQQKELEAVRKSCETKIAEKKASDEELQTIRSDIEEARKIRKALLVEQHDCLDEISLLNKEILKLRRVRCWAKAAPLDISFSKTGKPVYWKPNMKKPYGDYTVFISSKANIYHTDRICSGYHSKEAHIFDVIGHYRPCRKCADGFFAFTEVPDWYTGKETSAEEYPDSLMINWRDQ
jgi:hypothetical protein